VKIRKTSYGTVWMWKGTDNVAYSEHMYQQYAPEGGL